MLLQDVFDRIDEYTAEARGIAWDTCHKIYILMDENQMDLMRRYGYNPLISWKEMPARMMSEQIVEWYKDSCGLRFVNAVYSDERGFVDVVSQFEDDEDDDE
jgi:hypothetical protein